MFGRVLRIQNPSTGGSVVLEVVKNVATRVVGGLLRILQLHVHDRGVEKASAYLRLGILQTVGIQDLDARVFLEALLQLIHDCRLVFNDKHTKSIHDFISVLADYGVEPPPRSPWSND